MSKAQQYVKKSKKIFYYASYARKSSEEEDSRSINNQIAVMEAEYKLIIENDTSNDYINMGTYSDMDYTGTDSERPDFKKLLKNIGSGKINMLMVTDLSRLSRNISESINYVQGLFIALDVRFVSTQLPSLDSYIQPEKVYSLEIPMQSMMNENHCAETSFKVRRTFDRLRADGKFIGAFAGYGWKKDPEDKHKLLLDEEPFQVLQMIKDWLFQGNNAGMIANRLNEKGIVNPQTYKKSIGLNYQNSMSNCSIYWSSQMIRRILSRPENVGDLIQGRTRIRSYKIHVAIKTDPSEWFVCKDAIPAIFTRDEQKLITSALEKTTRVSPSNIAKEVYLFSGFLRCPDCGKSIIRKKSKSYVYYMCYTYKNYKMGCTKHSIKHDDLEYAVLTTIQKQIEIAVDLQNVLETIDKAPIEKKMKLDYNKVINSKKRELDKILSFKKSLYEDWKNECITFQEYKDMKFDYTEKEISLNSAIENLNEEVIKMEKVCDVNNPFITSFVKNRNIKKLSRDVLMELVEYIHVFEDKRITIKFKFADEYQRLVKSLDEMKSDCKRNI